MNVERRPNVLTLSGTVSDLLIELKDRYPKCKTYYYVNKIQSAAFKKAKQNSSNFDFAENYSTVYQDEIQTAHWSHGQITIITCCIWFGQIKLNHLQLLVTIYRMINLLFTIICKRYSRKLMSPQ